MLTKYVLTLGSTDYDVPDEDLKNWDDIAFTLKRSDYSGVMRSFSTEFVFAGDTKDRLWAAYRSNGFHTTAKIAVYTITDRHGYVKQYEAALDFSTLEFDEGTLTLNALDNSLAALVKAKKSQKYEYEVSSFTTERVMINRMKLQSYALYDFAKDTINAGAYVSLSLRNSGSQIISKEYIEVCDEAWGGGQAENSFFATVAKRGAGMTMRMSGYVRCRLWPPAVKPDDPSVHNDSPLPTPQMNIWTLEEDEQGHNDRVFRGMMYEVDLLHMNIRGQTVDMMVGGVDAVYTTLAQLKAAQSTFYNGQFGVVGSVSARANDSYWTDNTVYEYQDGEWMSKGAPKFYAQDRWVDSSVTIAAEDLYQGMVVYFRVSDFGQVETSGCTFYVQWADPVRPAFECRGIRPLVLLSKLMSSIAPGTTVSLSADSGGLLANTLIIPGEELRQIDGAKLYTTFNDFAGWMEAVFGFTYSIVGTTLSFVHRSSVFTAEVSKDLPSVADVKFSVADDLIYSQVEAGYSKKEYGEIDGRLETNFTNYYATAYTLTDKKLSLISKYRSDGYGVEFTARKSESQTTDDKADEDVFFVKYAVVSSVKTYTPGNNSVYAPAVCATNNGAFIAVMGNGMAVHLTMTSSDGNNALTNITIPANSALFTCGELSFTTEDSDAPADVNAMVRLTAGGFVYTGFIKEAKARFGRVNGMEYTIIIKSLSPTS